MGKKRRVNPWPFKLPVHPENDPLASLPDDHPAKQALIAHARCKLNCAGRDIPWPGKEDEAFDQEFYSDVMKRRWSFAGIIYAYVNFCLIADEWLEHPPHISERERLLLGELPKRRSMLLECRAAAEKDRNHRVLELLPYAEQFFSTWEESIYARLREDGIEPKTEH